MKINYTECMYNPTLLYDLATLCSYGGGCGSVSLWAKWIAEGNPNISCPLKNDAPRILPYLYGS